MDLYILGRYRSMVSAVGSTKWSVSLAWVQVVGDTKVGGVVLLARKKHPKEDLTKKENCTTVQCMFLFKL